MALTRQAWVGLRRYLDRSVDPETDASFRDRVLSAMRPPARRGDLPLRRGGTITPTRVRMCADCNVLHDDRLECDPRTRAAYQLAQVIRFDGVGPGPGTSKRCTCHTTANQHTRECALAGQPPTETSK